MTIIAAVTDDREGRLALIEAVAEAKQLGTDVVVVNLGTTELDVTSFVSDGVALDVVNRRGKDKDDSADAVLDEITARQATRLVIGVKRRTAVGKAILGSMSQRLLLTSPVPVLAVKVPDDGLPPSTFDSLPAGLRRVTG